EEQENFFSLTQKEFKDLVEKVTISCSTDDSRPILKGCLFEVNQNLLTAVSLDGFRMSVVKKEVEASGEFKAVIPARTLNEIKNLLNKESEKITIFIQKNTLFAKIESTIVYSRLLEGEYVKYNHILPNNFENIVTINKAMLLGSIERASIVAKNDRNNVIKFEIKEDIMCISSRSEVGCVNENVNITLSGKDLVIAFNGKYISEYLKTITEDFININLNSAIDPCVLTSVSNQDYLYLVLPVRING
ncbi:MAG: DNA polymerase III subunit beta, partial [Clostridia bacterium]|nr:DNA polymerase III subunit beta [Clostridia bacterium]